MSAFVTASVWRRTGSGSALWKRRGERSRRSMMIPRSRFAGWLLRLARLHAGQQDVVLGKALPFRDASAVGLFPNGAVKRLQWVGDSAKVTPVHDRPTTGEWVWMESMTLQCARMTMSLR